MSEASAVVTDQRRLVSDPVTMGRLADRDGGWICSYCGIALAHLWEHFNFTPVLWQGSVVQAQSCRPGFAFVEKDHVVPRARGGSNDLSNLVLACNKCNQRKGARSAEVFRAILAGEKA